jgi:hypothetical protein
MLVDEKCTRRERPSIEARSAVTACEEVVRRKGGNSGSK